MTRVSRLIGLPVILDGVRIGVVSSANYHETIRTLAGLSVHFRSMRAGFLPRESVSLIGDNAVIASGLPTKNAKRFEPKRVRDTSGLRLGHITDALVDESSLGIAALELSFGPIDDLITGRRWVREFVADTSSGDVIIPCGAWRD